MALVISDWWIFDTVFQNVTFVYLWAKVKLFASWPQTEGTRWKGRKTCFFFCFFTLVDKNQRTTADKSLECELNCDGLFNQLNSYILFFYIHLECISYARTVMSTNLLLKKKHILSQNYFFLLLNAQHDQSSVSQRVARTVSEQG